MKTTTERNKELVLEAFDTLFNKRDYAAAEKFWSPDYIQHSAHIEPGREGLFFIEGALTSTELVLQEQLELGGPEWLPEQYYLGPRA
jgi:hypothetical protein